VKTFSFESYGVPVSILASNDDLLQMTIDIARKSLLGNLRTVVEPEAAHIIRVGREDGSITLDFDGEDCGKADSDYAFANYFDTRIRLLIAEFAVDRVFIHAGVVSWRGRAILLPGESHAGKSTLVTELIKRGADYMSDEYAVVDAEASVHAYPRPISMRSTSLPTTTWKVPLDGLNTNVPERAVEPGLILFTRYQSDGVWAPKMLTTGKGVLQLVPHTVSIRVHPNFTMSVLSKLASRGIIAESLRGEAENASQMIIDLVDKTIF